MNKLFYLILPAIALLVLSFSWKTTDNQDWELKVSPEILQKAQAGEQVEFIVFFNEQARISLPSVITKKEEKGAYVFQQLKTVAQRTQAGLIQYLEQKNVNYQSLFIVNTLKTKGDLALIEAIASRVEVGNLQPNPSVKLIEPRLTDEDMARSALEWGIEKINADDVWALGHTGENVIVGGQDTGYEWEHAAIKEQYRGWDGTTANHDYSWHDAIHEWNEMNGNPNNPCGYDALEPCDDNNHGTHTMGTMVGDDGNGNQIGVAPGAKWICCRNMERGAGTPFSYMECFEWFLAPTDVSGNNPDPTMAPHVINNSWACPESEGCNSSNWEAMRLAVENLSTAGVFVVVSAGNEGSSCSSIGNAPSFFDESYSIGATSSSDAIAGFSSRGPILADASNRMKPDVSAPGVQVRSAVRGGGYSSFSGTSMAGPHVAGAVALLISADPTLAGDIDRIEDLLNTTAEQLVTTQGCGTDGATDVPNNTFGYGRIDVLSAVTKALEPVNVVDVLLENINVFPNPFKDQISIQTGDLQGEASFELFTTTGQLVKQQSMNLDQGTTSITTQGLASGVYMYKINYAEGSISGKLVK